MWMTELPREGRRFARRATRRRSIRRREVDDYVSRCGLLANGNPACSKPTGHLPAGHLMIDARPKRDRSSPAPSRLVFVSPEHANTISGGRKGKVRQTGTPQARSLKSRTHARTTRRSLTSGSSKAAMLFSIALVNVALPAQLPPLPAQSFYEIGKIDWTMPCGPWSVNTEMSSAPWDRLVDPGYPGPQVSYACRLGGIFYLRGRQHDAICPQYLPLGASLPPVFLFGPRTSSFIQVNMPHVYPGQNIIFNSSAMAVLPTHHGPWEFDPAIDCWAAQVLVPTSTQLAGTEWEAQAAFVSTATGKVHFGISRYTRIM